MGYTSFSRILYYALFAYAILIIAKPQPYETGIQNIPLLVAIFVIFFAYKLRNIPKHILLSFKIKRLLSNNRTRIKAFSALPRSYGKCGTFDIVADGRKNTLNIVVIARKNKYLRYHFDNPERLEYYNGGRYIATWRGNKRFQIQVGMVDTTKLKGKRRLPWRDIDERDINIVVFDKLPVAVSDSVSRETVCNGQKLCGKIYLYDFESFKANIEKIL